MMRNDESEELMFWDRGISTRYASKLTCKDVKDFVEKELNVKCGRVTRSKVHSMYGIDFIIRRPFSFKKNTFWADSLTVDPIDKNKLVFTAYDFKFNLTSECFVSEADRQAWINYMTEKFGTCYNEFMFKYTQDD